MSGVELDGVGELSQTLGRLQEGLLAELRTERSADDERRWLRTRSEELFGVLRVCGWLTDDEAQEGQVARGDWLVAHRMPYSDRSAVEALRVMTRALQGRLAAEEPAVWGRAPLDTHVAHKETA